MIIVKRVKTYRYMCECFILVIFMFISTVIGQNYYTIIHNLVSGRHSTEMYQICIFKVKSKH